MSELNQAAAMSPELEAMHSWWSTRDQDVILLISLFKSLSTSIEYRFVQAV